MSKVKARMVEQVGVSRKSRELVACVMGVGLVLMLGAALTYMVEQPGLIVHQQGGAAVAPEAGAGMPGATDAQNAALMGQMERLQKNPQDTEALLNLAGHFLHTEDYARAENFAMRAVMATQGEASATPLYMLSMAQHSQGRHQEAAISLEKSLALKEDAETRYSLGILYRYFLKDEERGKAELQKALAAPGATDVLKKQVDAELTKKP